MTARVSIIVPVLNEAATLPDALRALAGWRVEGAEVIVVDGGNADAHGATCTACAGLTDAVLLAPRGRARQMNAGAARAQGDVLLFLHADTRLPPGAPAAVLGALQARAWGRFDVAIDGASPLLPVIATFMNLRSRLSGIATGDQAIFVTRAAFAAVGGFPDQPLMEDIELSRRLRRAGRPACLRLRVRTSGRRWDEFGVWRTMALMWRLRWRYWRGARAEDLARLYR
jgi:rSAM/selenodomain-associated transferase 2